MSHVASGIRVDAGPEVRRASAVAPVATEAALVPSERRDGSRGRLLLALVCLALLIVWGRWWIRSYKHDRLLRGQWTWVPALPFLAGDFKVHIDHTARRMVAGHDPYDKGHDWVCALFPYPPMVPRLFAWVAPISTEAAIGVWLAALALIFAGTSWLVARWRGALNLAPMPPLLIAVAVLYSTPVLFAMERGQSDPLVLPLLALSIWLLGDARSSRSRWLDALAGALLAVAAWLKYYPGLMLLGLIPFRRWTPLAAGLLVAAAIAGIDHGGVAQSVENGLALAALGERTDDACHATQHSISKSWAHVCRVLRLKPMADVPGSVATALVLGPMLAVVSLAVGRVAEPWRSRLMPAYALWVIAAGTFALPYSNDYNLVFLPLAALATWDRRDRVFVHMMMGLLLLWWQPLRLPVDGTVIFLTKLAGLWAVGASLTSRAREAEAASGSIPV